MKKRIAILGSTGSIGRQALEVISVHQDIFEVEVLTAYSNADLLIKQAIEYQPNAVVIADENQYQKVKDALFSHDIKVFAGEDSLEQITEMSTIDIVLVALVGFSGLKPTYHAILQKKPIALANKEALVVAGGIVMKTAQENNVPIIPVDSEHSAIFQCLAGEIHNKLESITITASGGPFFGKKTHELQSITPKQALKHPNWVMGNKITIDSATLMNKGFEVIEAKWLFGACPEQIEVVIHPQSLIHSMVQFEDGSIKAQIGLPDMKLPIQYAFAYPERIQNSYPRLDFFKCQSFSFEKPDTEVFRNLAFAYDAMIKGGNMPCILNAANEIVVAAFLREKIGFLQMSDIIEKTMQTVSYIAKPAYEEYMMTDKEAREIALSLCKNS